MSEQAETYQVQKLDLFLILKNFWRLFRKTFYLVLLAAALCGAIAGIRSYRSYSPYYRAQAVLSVSSGYTPTIDILNRTSYYDANATRQVINTFSDIINTDAMREMILQELGVDYINGSITPEIIANSNLFTLTVTSSSPQDAYNILVAVINNYPKLATLVIGGTEISMLDEPTLPTAPVNSPSWRGAARKGALLGGLLALAAIALLAQLRQTIHSAEEMKRYSSLTCLSSVPAVSQRRRKTSKRSSLSMLNASLPSGYAESIRTLRTRLLHRQKGNSCQVFMVTSTAPTEGKSTVSANLAVALAQAGSNVILVDADMRAQSLQGFFGLRGKLKGLPELLAADRVPDLGPYLQAVPGVTLRLLASSSSSSSPSRLLQTSRIQKILSVLRSNADYIIIDTPPIGLLADAASFAPLVDGVIYVIREDFVSRSEVLSSLQSLSDSQANLVGYVLNGASRASGRYGYGKYGGSGYRAYGTEQ